MVTTMFICVSPPLCSFQTTVFFLSPWSFENIIHINITRAPCYLNSMAGFQSCVNSKGTRFNGLFIVGISNNHDSKINHENIHSSFGLSTRQMLLFDSGLKISDIIVTGLRTHGWWWYIVYKSSGRKIGNSCRGHGLLPFCIGRTWFKLAVTSSNWFLPVVVHDK